MRDTFCDALQHSSYQNFWFKIPWVPPLKYSRNVVWSTPSPSPTPNKILSGLGTWDLSWSGVTPLPGNENLVRTLHFGFELVWSNPPPPNQGLVWEVVWGDYSPRIPSRSISAIYKCYRNSGHQCTFYSTLDDVLKAMADSLAQHWWYALSGT